MGVTQHSIMAATFWDEDTVSQAWYWVQLNVPEHLRKLFVQIDGIMNGYTSIVMVPDGSNEGRQMSIECDNWRQQAVDYFESLRGGNVVVASYGEQGERIEHPKLGEPDFTHIKKERLVELLVMEERYKTGKIGEELEAFEKHLCSEYGLEWKKR